MIRPCSGHHESDEKMMRQAKTFATTVRTQGDDTDPADPLWSLVGVALVRVGAFGGVIRGSKTRAAHEATAARGTEYFHTSP